MRSLSYSSSYPSPLLVAVVIAVASGSTAAVAAVSSSARIYPARTTTKRTTTAWSGRSSPRPHHNHHTDPLFSSSSDCRPFFADPTDDVVGTISAPMGEYDDDDDVLPDPVSARSFGSQELLMLPRQYGPLIERAEAEAVVFPPTSHVFRRYYRHLLNHRI